MTVFKVKEGTHIDVEQLYIPGVVIKTNCPECNEERGMDLSEEYLSDPQMGVQEDVNFHCFACDKRWTVPIKVHLAVEML